MATSKKKASASKGAKKSTAGGFEMPGELALFEKEQKKEDCFFGSSIYGELTLTRKPDGADHYTSSAQGESWALMFDEIAWVGEEADGGLLGYWKAAPGTPVIYLDNEGQLQLTGTTLVDHFAWRRRWEGDEDPPEELLAFCKKLK